MKETYIPRASQNIAQVDYDSGSSVLNITFQDGRSYDYTGVPQSVFMGVQNAPSAGSYFYRQIRGRFPESEV